MVLQTPKAATELRLARVGKGLRCARTAVSFVIGLKVELSRGQIG